MAAAVVEASVPSSMAPVQAAVATAAAASLVDSAAAVAAIVAAVPQEIAVEPRKHSPISIADRCAAHIWTQVRSLAAEQVSVIPAKLDSRLPNATGTVLVKVCHALASHDQTLPCQIRLPEWLVKWLA